MAALEALLDDAEHRDEAMELIRSQIERIEVRPRETAGVDLFARGDLARLLALSTRVPNGESPDA